MKILSKIPNRVLRFILEILWDIEDLYYLADNDISRYFYRKLKWIIGYLEEEMYRRNVAYRNKRLGGN